MKRSTRRLQPSNHERLSETLRVAYYDEDTGNIKLKFYDGLQGIIPLDELPVEIEPESEIMLSCGYGTVLAVWHGNKVDEVSAAELRRFVDPFHDQRLWAKVAPVGALVRKTRRSRFMTQKALGRRAGISQPMISRIERDVVRPRIDTLQRIADAMDTSVAELLRIRKANPLT